MAFIECRWHEWGESTRGGYTPSRKGVRGTTPEKIFKFKISVEAILMHFEAIFAFETRLGQTKHEAVCFQTCFEPNHQSMNNYFDPSIGLIRRWQQNLQLLKATVLIFNMFCRQSLVAFGNLITTSTESQMHFEECFLKAALASFPFENHLITNTLSWLNLLSLPFVGNHTYVAKREIISFIIIQPYPICKP